MVRAHFVHGLYQPLVIGTELVPSPFAYEECSWVERVYGRQSKTLESVASQRHVDIQCISMADIKDRLKLEFVVRDLNRRTFMFMLIYLSLAMLGSNALDEFSSRYAVLYQDALRNPYLYSQTKGIVLSEEEMEDAQYHSNGILFRRMLEVLST